MFYRFILSFLLILCFSTPVKSEECVIETSLIAGCELVADWVSNVSIYRECEHKFEGDYCFSLTNEGDSITIIRKNLDLDFTSFCWVLINMEMPVEEVAKLTMFLKDSSDRCTVITCECSGILTERGEVAFPFPDKTGIDLSSIKRLGFKFTCLSGEIGTFYIDNIRMAKLICTT